MARSGRFELPTPRFVVWCSIQLSYERGVWRVGIAPVTAGRTIGDASRAGKSFQGGFQGRKTGLSMPADRLMSGNLDFVSALRDCFRGEKHDRRV
jgi:hypothetical protein